MTNHAYGFTTAEFAELQAVTAELHGEWFPQFEGVHPADLPYTARLTFNLDRLAASVAGQAQRKSERAKRVQRQIDRANRRITD